MMQLGMKNGDTLLLQRDGGLGNPLDAADARTDQHSGRNLVVAPLRMPAGIVERLPCRAHREGDELVDLALILRRHPLVGIVGAIGAITARNLAGNFRGQIRDVELLDPPRTAFAREQAAPSGLDATPERRHHPHSGYDNASHSVQAGTPVLQPAGPRHDLSCELRKQGRLARLRFRTSRLPR